MHDGAELHGVARKAELAAHTCTKESTHIKERMQAYIERKSAERM